MLDRNAIYRVKSDNFVARKIDQETILVPLVSNVADMTGVLTLNEVATSLLDAINGENTINDIMVQLINDYDVEMEELKQDIEHFIDQALLKKIIEKVENEARTHLNEK